MSNELTYVRAAAEILKEQGRVFIGYITAGLEPYSAQQKPDISFEPASGPNAGQVFFIEVRCFESGRLPPGYTSALREHKAFAQDGAESEYGGFAFASNVEIGSDAHRELSDLSIDFLGPITGGEMLAEKIRAWAFKRV
jgi:hypothetical protein